MADPVTLAGVSLAGSAGGGILGAFGAQQSGAAARQMYQYQSGIAMMNRQINLQNADWAIASGESQAVNAGMKARAIGGQIRAAQGASGIDVGSGSSEDVRAGQKLVSDIDVSNIRTNAARVAYGFQTKAATDEAQANLYQMAGTNAEEAGRIKALGSLVSGAASVSDKWLQMGQYGLG